MSALVAGAVLGAGRLAAELSKTHLSGALYTFANINFLHFAVILFLICVAILIVVSLMTAAPAAEKLANLTYATLVVDKQASAFDPAWRRRDVVLSVILALTVGLVWLYFTG